MKQSSKYDVVVVGAGHAGIEAAVAAHRLGAKTLIVTFSKNDLGEMSCNPAIGGLGKGHLVREIDALGGLIGEAADEAGIQFRVLNKSRGAAVQGPRAQIDRNLYKKAIKRRVYDEGIQIVEDEVVDIKLDLKTSAKIPKVAGVILSMHGNIGCGSLIITTGTFLGGRIYCGSETWEAGRLGCQPSSRLPKFFKKHNFFIRKLKTGTPARLLSESVEFKKCKIQYGDSPAEPFSFLNTKIEADQVECFITHTNQKTHQIIKENIKVSPMYNGTIKTKGPRYCPSIEDKVMKFAQREAHQIFLEPETKQSLMIYPNGISTSLPKPVQEKFLQSISGLENVKISKYGYAIEYESIDGSEIKKSYETKKISGLFLAGQINGTTGYEEAAGQGILAGINAVKILAGYENKFVISRAEAYLGVLTDDIAAGGFIEPYRMFTSRAEYRIQLRADNADERLTDTSIKIGLCQKKRAKDWLAKKKKLSEIKQTLNKIKATPQKINRHGLKINMDGKRRSAFDALGYKDSSWDKISEIWPELATIDLDKNLKKQIFINAFYSKYIKRQNREIASINEDKKLKLKADIDYDKIQGISNEAKDNLKAHQPTSIAEASKLPGMTPVATAILLQHLKKTG